MVDLAKLKFFQTRFTRDLISGAIPDPDALSRRVLKPIQSELERLERELFEEPVSELVAEVVGDHPKKRISTLRERKQPTEKYIHEILKASKAPVGNPRQFIKDNLYAFWPPSTLAYKNSFSEFQSGMRRIQMTREKEKILNVDISKVLHHFRNSLDALTEEEWTLENVGNTAKKLADSVTYYSTEKDILMDHAAGWKFLRWALLVGSPGLSVVPMMLLLGRYETLKRLRIARRCANVKEEQLAVEAKRVMEQDQLLRLAKGRRHSTWEGERSADDEVSEPRNVKVRMRENELAGTQDKAKGFLRPIHHESHLPEIGPFWSPPKPKPIRPPRPEPEPEPEPLPPQPITPEEFKTGQRHILRNDQPGPANNRSPRSRRVNKRARQKPARKPEPADEISPFEPGGAFFAPETEAGTSFGQPESMHPQRRTQPPPDSSSHVLKPADTETPPGPFMRGMSDKERQAYIELMMAQKVYDKARLERSAAQLRASGEPTRRNPVKQEDSGTPADARGATGSFYAGKPVHNHPLRIQADGGRLRDDEGERQPEKDVEKKRRTSKRVRPSQINRPGGSFYIGEPVREHPVRLQAEHKWKERKLGVERGGSKRVEGS